MNICMNVYIYKERKKERDMQKNRGEAQTKQIQQKCGLTFTENIGVKT